MVATGLSEGRLFPAAAQDRRSEGNPSGLGQDAVGGMARTVHAASLDRGPHPNFHE